MKAERLTLELRDLFGEIAAATMSEMGTQIIHLTEELRAERERADKVARERDEALAAVTRWESWAETGNHNMMCDCPSCDHFWANAKIELGPAT